MMSLDLDDFKLVNDSFGHPAGDELLTQVAGRLVESVRTADTVARLGGDEFAVLVEGPPEMARLAAHRVARAFDEPFAIDDQQLTVRPSIGLAVVAASDSNVSAHALLKRADIAMYSAKRSRSGAVHTYTPDMDPIGVESEQEEGSRLLDQLRRAIDNMELSLVYQPKFSLRDGSITGVEALVRWPHPVLGVLVPKHFLPLVRRHGLVTSVTELVLAQALDDAARWRVRGHRVPIAVNIAAPSLLDLDLPNQIMVALAERGLSPDVLTIEITEDLLVDNVERARTVLTRLRENGIRVAVDDFGAGYSALAYLRDLPIDEVKLDKSFVGPILEDARAAAIVRAVIELAHVLGLTTVAEGVESDEVSAKLHAYGCDNVQGFGCSPPVSAAVVLDLLENERQCCSTACETPDSNGRVLPLAQHPVS
jgi:diguanylate cyclase (GGDEF)-like protein